MKRYFSLLAAVSLITALFTGCQKKDYKREALLTTMTLCSLGTENTRNVTAVKDWRRSKQRSKI